MSTTAQTHVPSDTATGGDEQPLEELVSLVYASAAAPSLTPEGIARVLEVSRRNNARLGVTGMLLHHRGSFFQVLEGPPAVVDALYAKIFGDERHEGVVLLIRETVEERTFGDWTMGWSELTTAQLASLPGCNDFFSSGSCFRALGEGRARQVLDGFRGGRWHVGHSPDRVAA
ncbi:MAG: BLUF domain-containing protein [Acidimicrobiales bacterium]